MPSREVASLLPRKKRFVNASEVSRPRVGFRKRDASIPVPGRGNGAEFYCSDAALNHNMKIRYLVLKITRTTTSWCSKQIPSRKQQLARRSILLPSHFHSMILSNSLSRVSGLSTEWDAPVFSRIVSTARKPEIRRACGSRQTHPRQRRP